MTEQAPPDYYFQNIIFNPKYYDNEVNNNITKYEADNKYIKYNSSNLQLTKTEAGLTTTINDLRLTSIGRLNNLFNLPTNTSTATPYSRLVLIDNTTRSTTWFPSSGNVGYNSTTSILTTENASGAIPDITNLVMSGSIGSSTAEKFILPSNSSTASVNSVLTLSNISTKATTWVSLPTAITNYTKYDNTTKTLISNVSGTPTTVIDLVMSGSIGSSTVEKFVLPSNSSTASVNSVLTLSNISTKATTWVSLPTAITNYANYDNTTKTLISNVSGTPATITSLNVSGSILSSVFNSGAPGSVLDIAANQIAGVLNIGNNAGRTGAINIGTLTTGAHAINIGNSASTQTVSINRPLTTNTINTNNNTINAGTSSVSGGSILSSVFNSGAPGSVLDIAANQIAGVLNIGNNAGRTGAINIGTLTTGAHAINIGNSASTQTVSINRPLTTNTINTNNNTLNTGTGTITGGALTCTTITTNNNTINAGTGVISGGSFSSDNYNSKGSTFDLGIGNTQTSGSINIGNSTARTGSVNICTSASNNNINIGNISLFQQLNINIPIRLGSFVYTSGSEMGFSQNNTSVSTAVPPGTRVDTTISNTNLINHGNYMISYSLTIAPTVNFSITKLIFGLRTTGYVTNCHKNESFLTSSTTAIRLTTTGGPYVYQGSGFFKYNSSVLYTFSYQMDYLATSPAVVTNIDLIRIS